MPIPESELIEVLTEVGPEIGAFAARRLASVERRFDVDDLKQIVAMKALRYRESIESNDKEVVRHWVKKLAYNEYKTAVTAEFAAKRSVACEVSGEEISPAVVQDDQFELAVIAEDMEFVTEAMKQIPASWAKAVRMRYLECLSNAEIAVEMQTTVNAVRLLVSRGLAAIRARIV